MALGIAGKRGQGRNQLSVAETAKHFGYVMDVERSRRRGLSLSEALSEVADQHPITRDSLQRWHREYEEDAVHCLVVIEKHRVM